MAQGIVYVCDTCGKSIDYWDDGNPYWIDEKGEKQYAYHPDPNRGRCIGNDIKYLCLSCGEVCAVDSTLPVSNCPKCQAENIVETRELDGKPCPFCGDGCFGRDTTMEMIS